MVGDELGGTNACWRIDSMRPIHGLPTTGYRPFEVALALDAILATTEYS